MEGSDTQLLASAIGGNTAALTALLECHGGALRSALERSYHRRLHGQVDLDDVMQITYVEAFLRIRDFVPSRPNAFRGWLRRIAENNLRDAIRKFDVAEKRRAPALVLSAEQTWGTRLEASGGSGTPSRVAGRNEVSQLLETALRQLPEDYERVLRLYDLEGHTGPEVARMMNRSQGAVKMLVARARDRLIELLGSGSKFFSDRA